MTEVVTLVLSAIACGLSGTTLNLVYGLRKQKAKAPVSDEMRTDLRAFLRARLAERAARQEMAK